MPLNPNPPRPVGQRWLKLQAMAWLALGQDARAVQVFDRMLAQQPDDAHALASRAHHLAQAGRRDAAIADLQALVDCPHVVRVQLATQNAVFKIRICCRQRQQLLQQHQFRP